MPKVMFTGWEHGAMRTGMHGYRKERKTEKISSPLKGEVIALSDVQDEAFSSGALGLGAAVDPKEGVLYAPADGTISVEWNC